MNAFPVKKQSRVLAVLALPFLLAYAVSWGIVMAWKRASARSRARQALLRYQRTNRLYEAL